MTFTPKWKQERDRRNAAKNRKAALSRRVEAALQQVVTTK